MASEQNEPPRSGEFGNRAGAFSIVPRTSADLVNPGETFEIELYVSGYGEIGPAKLAFYPSPDVFDIGKSSIRFDIGVTDGRGTWGGQQTNVDPVGTALDLSGGQQKTGWPAPTLFFDLPESVARGGRLPQLVTETKQQYAPIHITLAVKRRTRPGLRFCRFQFTYFNGEQWCTTSEAITFTVRNFYQRNEGLVWSLGIIATLLGIALALKEIVGWFMVR